MAKHSIEVVAPATCNISCPARRHGVIRDIFTWICHQGDLEIRFAHGTPFIEGSVFTALRGYPTPEANVNVNGGCYKYSIRVTRTEGQVCELDPEIIIDETHQNWKEWFHESPWAGVALVATGAFLVAKGVKLLLKPRQQMDR